ncbi:MAG: hypothetical protein Q8K36_06700, partial [Alphaproteobacteria bacterium]|nr:hypothetical protein [Alphaproteobacteria bacterium]
MKFLTGLCLSVATIVSPLCASEPKTQIHSMNYEAAKNCAVASTHDEGPSTPVAPPPPAAAAAVGTQYKSNEKRSHDAGKRLFAIHDLVHAIGEYVGSINLPPLNETCVAVIQESAAITYAQSLLAGKNVPKEALEILRMASADIKNTAGFSEREQVRNTIMNHLRAPGSDFIHLQNPIPPFLADLVHD